MTDASKRRFEEEEEGEPFSFDGPGYQAAMEEFEVVQAINEFNSGGGAVGNVAEASSAAMAAAGFPVARELQPMTHYAVQGEDQGPPTENNAWFPEIDEGAQDFSIQVPEEFSSPQQWGQTIVKMDKYKSNRYTYEQILRQSLGGRSDTAAYCQFITDRHAATYRRFGSRHQAADFAGYLCRYKVKVIKVPGSGFQRELAQ